MSNLEGRKILITGGAGFLASYLAEECYAEGAAIFGIDLIAPLNCNIWSSFSTNDLSSSNAEELFKKQPFDTIFHLAGSASVFDSVQSPEKDFNSIVPVTFRLIQLVHKHSPEAHLVLFSSAAVYGNPDEIPVKETAAIHPVSPYGIHKALAEDLVKYYSAYFNFSASALRIFSAFGEGLRKQIFWDVMCRYEKALQQNKNNKIELNLFGTGHESRDFIHAKDVAKAAVLIAADRNKKNNFNIFNVAGGNETGIKTAVEYLFCKATIKPEIKFTGQTRAGDPEQWLADISELKQLGFEANINLKDCLCNYYNWFMER